MFSTCLSRCSLPRICAYSALYFSLASSRLSLPAGCPAVPAGFPARTLNLWFSRSRSLTFLRASSRFLLASLLSCSSLARPWANFWLVANPFLRLRFSRPSLLRFPWSCLAFDDFFFSLVRAFAEEVFSLASATALLSIFLAIPTSNSVYCPLLVSSSVLSCSTSSRNFSAPCSFAPSSSMRAFSRSLSLAVS